MLACVTCLLLALQSVLEARASRAAEILVLRQHFAGAQPQTTAGSAAELILVWCCRLFPSLFDTVVMVKPATVLRWRRGGCSGLLALEVLIRRMSRDKRWWGAPRIHGELLRLGFAVAESTVSRYMIKTRGPRALVIFGEVHLRALSRLTRSAATRSKLTWRWKEKRRTTDAHRSSAPSWRSRSSVVSIINMFEFRF